MDCGLFTMPSHPPERSLEDGQDWDLQVLRWADELGYREAWIGEHHTAPWEPHPAPDLLVAQALQQTSRIRLGPGGFLLPFHHPAELANRVAMLDHLAQGRLNFGIAASGLPSDWAMFDVDGFAGVNRQMTRESLALILRLWTEEEPFEHVGQFWTVRKPAPMWGTLRAHIRPLQRPHPPISVSGLSPRSETLKIAGEYGFLPMSPEQDPSLLASHWEAVEEGAQRSGRVARRADWRIVRDVFVAETDAEALRLAVDGPMGRMWSEYYLGLLRDSNSLKYMKHDERVADDEVTVEYCARHQWLVGSPDTVAEKLAALDHAVGGFGVLLAMCYDYADDPEPWRRSMELLATEVMPRFAEPVAEGG